MKKNNKVSLFTQKLTSGVLLSSLVLAVTACGRLEQDPTKKFDTFGNAQPPGQVEPGTKTTMNTLFYIDSEDDLVFVQGEARELKFVVRNSFANPDSEIHYDLKLKSEESMPGMSFGPSPTVKNVWVMRWQPAKNLLSSTEPVKKFNVQLQVVLLPASSASVKKQFYGQEDTYSYSVTLIKDFSQPILAEKVQITPSGVISPDQKVKIQFKVSAQGTTSPEDLDVQLSRGPESVTSELVQLDALEGMASSRPRRVDFLGTDSQGRNQYLYEVVFDARRFVSLAQSQIQAEPTLKAKYAAGAFTTVEALFYVDVINKYNGGRSVQKTIQFNVNLKGVSP